MALIIDADADAYGRTTSLPSGDGQTAVTVAGFMFFNTDRNAPSAFCSIDNNTTSGSADRYFYMETPSDGTSLQVFWKNANATSGSSATILSMVAGNWYFVAFTRAASTAINGYAGLLTAASLSTQAGTADAGTWTESNFRIGRTQYTGEFLNGRIAGVKVWNAALTAAELEMERWQLLPVRWANLDSFYPLVGPDATANAVDLGGAGLTLTTGTATFGDGPPVPWKQGRRRLNYIPAAAAGGSDGTLINKLLMIGCG